MGSAAGVAYYFQTRELCTPRSIDAVNRELWGEESKSCKRHPASRQCFCNRSPSRVNSLQNLVPPWPY